jgi:hypothetical protein
VGGATLTIVIAYAAFLSGEALEEALAILFLSVIGSALFVGLVVCSRRFDVEPGTDTGGDEGEGGGGDRGPRPGDGPGSLATMEPPLGEIRASRRTSRQPIARERSTARD